jgi:hypothetical protein
VGRCVIAFTLNDPTAVAYSDTGGREFVETAAELSGGLLVVQAKEIPPEHNMIDNCEFVDQVTWQSAGSTHYAIWLNYLLEQSIVYKRDLEGRGNYTAYVELSFAVRIKTIDLSRFDLIYGHSVPPKVGRTPTTSGVENFVLTINKVAVPYNIIEKGDYKYEPKGVPSAQEVEVSVKYCMVFEFYNRELGVAKFLNSFTLDSHVPFTMIQRNTSTTLGTYDVDCIGRSSYQLFTPPSI